MSKSINQNQSIKLNQRAERFTIINHWFFLTWTYHCCLWFWWSFCPSKLYFIDRISNNFKDWQA